jgi:chitin disaccharide deacetylase
MQLSSESKGVGITISASRLLVSIMHQRMRFLLPLLVACLAQAFAQTLAVPATAKTNPAERFGYPPSARLLIIHADDLGMTHSVNRATFLALEKGWITSASILVPCPWFPEVARWAHDHPNSDLGIHLALTSEWTDLRWGPVSGVSRVPSLVDAQGYFPLDTPEVDQNAKMPDVEFELRSQIDRAKNAGIHVTHLDMHMAGMVSSAGLFGVYRKLGDEDKLPILLEQSGTHGPPEGASVSPDEITLQHVVTMEPGVAPKDWLAWYKKQLAPLPPGAYQLTVHLAYDDEEMRGATWNHPDWGAAWRQRDFDTMQSPAFRQFLKDQGFILVTWRDLSRSSFRSR